MVARAEAYGRWLAASPDVPELMVNFAPAYGAMTEPAVIDWCARTVASLDIEHFAEPSGHHTPEDQPELLAAAISGWLDRNHLQEQGVARPRPATSPCPHPRGPRQYRAS